MGILKKIKRGIKIFIGDTEKLEDIPMMRYPKGEKPKDFVNPFAKYNSRNSRIRYKR